VEKKEKNTRVLYCGKGIVDVKKNLDLAKKLAEQTPYH
jgi:hypothetical protein